MDWKITVTDTINGQANYSRLVIEQISMPDDTNPTQLSKAFKHAVGYSGTNGESAWVGEGWEFRPYKECTLIYAQPVY